MLTNCSSEQFEFAPVEGRRVDSGTKRNGLSEADLDVSAKLLNSALTKPGVSRSALAGR
jgi:hypothetical protein